MDAYEATKIVFSRIQSMDPENAAKIMGFLLSKDHSEKEMIRLAFGPESLLQSFVLNALDELGLFLTSSFPVNATPVGTTTNPFLLGRQNSVSRLLASPRQMALSSPSSWATPSPFSRAKDAVGGGDDRIDDIKLHDQLCFLSDSVVSKAGSEVFYPEDYRDPFDAELLPYEFGWNSAIDMASQRRSCSMSDLYVGADHTGLCCKPCLYFARGYCKNGSSCRFLHGLPDEALATGKMDAVCEQEKLFRSKSQRITSVASAFSYMPPPFLPQSPSAADKCMNFLLQKQQSRSQRAAAAAAALMLGDDETNKFMTRPRMERNDFAGTVNPGSRQIYLTFPAESTFREEDVSNYFSIYGPVQDVRIPYQQKRMFGFVTFVYPETVKLILAKGNPHFVCDSRVLVKPYKEKGKLPDKKLQGDRADLLGCTTPICLDCRDPYDLQLLGARTLGGGGYQGSLFRRKLEERLELQQAIELQQRRFMEMQLLDLKGNLLSSAAGVGPPSPLPSITTTHTPPNTITNLNGDKSLRPPESGSAESRADQEKSLKEEADLPQSVEHNLPESPFASPTKYADGPAPVPSTSASSTLLASTLLPATSTLEKSFASCFFQIPSFSSGQGAVGL